MRPINRYRTIPGVIGTTVYKCILIYLFICVISRKNTAYYIKLGYVQLVRGIWLYLHGRRYKYYRNNGNLGNNKVIMAA